MLLHFPLIYKENCVQTLNSINYILT